MDNCVGSYCPNVESGRSVIYSLRDPQNNPHITMETDSYNEVEQIQGKSNSEPKNIYKNMIKEWIQSDKNQEIKKEEDEQLLKDWNYTRKGGRKRRKTRKRSLKSTRRKSIISRIRKSFKRKGEIKALEGVAKIATDTALTM